MIYATKNKYVPRYLYTHKKKIVYVITVNKTKYKTTRVSCVCNKVIQTTDKYWLEPIHVVIITNGENADIIFSAFEPTLLLIPSTSTISISITKA